jgi:hypothetical protein
MIASIVKQLSHWVAQNREELVDKGIEVSDRTPEPSSNIPWKGTVGLVKDDILVSYTVWERTIFQTELIVVDGKSGATLRSEDGNPRHPEDIEPVLNALVEDLLTQKYRDN